MTSACSISLVQWAGEYYGQPKPATSKHTTSAATGAQPVLSLELFINKVAFTERSELVHSSGGLGSVLSSTNTVQTQASRKRSGTQSVLELNAARQKHPSTQMESTFLPTHTNKKKASTTKITVEKAKCVQSQVDSQVKVSWPDDVLSTTAATAIISHAVFAAGRTKRVYELEIKGDDRDYVAKRFFRGGENGRVTAEENESLLKCESIRLKVLEWLVEEFLNHARSDDSSVEHFGRHPERNDKVGMTISALCHWIYIFTCKTEVYSDIQGSYMTIDGTDTLILFDPMTHTLNQDSGIRDYGEKGITKFLAEHQCNYICRGLSLSPFTKNEIENLDPLTNVLKAALEQFARERLSMQEKLACLVAEYQCSISASTLYGLQRKFGTPSVRKPPPEDMATAYVLEKVAQDVNQQNGTGTIGTLLANEGVMIPRDLIRKILAQHAPEGLQQRFSGANRIK
ncbi:hypothetical protein EST38_g9157 [Candolleomyces aberdarensis]|uniref:Alpha-type protein kinase domain-containing protein n=1 Tax=Candolleomyces aberdarensis TaxID=2316362 RepID=A0A4Q2DAN3_9AGAR|nr:hypothetical protein EST38_g9157 [Candolleomyces aberdarensis]